MIYEDDDILNVDKGTHPKSVRIKMLTDPIPPPNWSFVIYFKKRNSINPPFPQKRLRCLWKMYGYVQARTPLLLSASLMTSITHLSWFLFTFQLISAFGVIKAVYCMCFIVDKYNASHLLSLLPSCRTPPPIVSPFYQCNLQICF